MRSPDSFKLVNIYDYESTTVYVFAPCIIEPMGEKFIPFVSIVHRKGDTYKDYCEVNYFNVDNDLKWSLQNNISNWIGVFLSSEWKKLPLNIHPNLQEELDKKKVKTENRAENENKVQPLLDKMDDILNRAEESLDDIEQYTSQNISYYKRGFEDCLYFIRSQWENDEVYKRMKHNDATCKMLKGQS